MWEKRAGDAKFRGYERGEDPLLTIWPVLSPRRHEEEEKGERAATAAAQRDGGGGGSGEREEVAGSSEPVLGNEERTDKQTGTDTRLDLRLR